MIRPAKCFSPNLLTVWVVLFHSEMNVNGQGRVFKYIMLPASNSLFEFHIWCFEQPNAKFTQQIISNMFSHGSSKASLADSPMQQVALQLFSRGGYLRLSLDFEQLAVPSCVFCLDSQAVYHVQEPTANPIHETVTLSFPTESGYWDSVLMNRFNPLIV